MNSTRYCWVTSTLNLQVTGMVRALDLGLRFGGRDIDVRDAGGTLGLRFCCRHGCEAGCRYS